jgi:hypothetical protein
VLSWGWHTPFYRPLFALPLMDKWRNPLKWLEMTNFALATLSAFGVRHVMLSLDAGARRVRRGVFWFLVVTFSMLAFSLLASYPFTLILQNVLLSEQYTGLEVTHIEATIHSSLFFALILVAFFYAVLHVLWHPEPLHRSQIPNPWLDRVRLASLQPENMPLTLALSLIVLIVVQLAWVAGKFVQPLRLSVLTSTNGMLEELRSEGDRVRVSVATQDPILNVMLQNQFAANHISCLEISAASRVPDDLEAFFEAFGQDRARLWFLTGVKNVAVPQDFVPQLQHDQQVMPNILRADGYMLAPTPSPDVPSHGLVVLRDYMAKATFVPGVTFFPSTEAVLKQLVDPQWNPRATVLLSSAESKLTSPPPFAAKPLAPAQVDLKLYTANEIDAGVWTPQPGFLLINDQYDPDWQVEVNGEPAELLKADGLLRAVQVPAGRSDVTMRYASRYHIGEIIQQMTHIGIGDLSVSAEGINDFCDAAMVGAWIVAAMALWRRKSPAETS